MRHFLNGVEVSPRNRDEIGVVCDFTGNPDVLSLNTDTLVLPREANQMVKQHIQTNGLFIGIPYQVQMDGGITLDYYIDLCDPGSKPMLRQHEIEVKIKRSKGYDDFRSKADGTSFELIVKDNGIDFFNYKRIPYFIIKDNAAEQVLTLSLSIFVISKELIQAARDIAESFTALLSVGNLAEDLANFIIRLIYFAALYAAAINYVIELLKILFPPKRYLNGCYYKELMSKACQYLGYDFSSELFDNDPGWFLLPVPINRNNSESIFEKLSYALGNNFNLGYPTASDSVGLVGQFFDACEIQLNARTFIIGNTVHFERRDWLENNSTLVMQPALNIQADRDESFTYNTEDAWKRYYIHYAVDFSDINTAEGVNFGFSDAEYSCENSVPGANSNLITIKGLNDVSIPFAMGFNKDKLSLVETVALSVAQLIDNLTNVFTFGNGTSYATQISDRVNALKISQQYFSTTKSLYVIPRPNNTVLINQDFNTNNSARALWNKYHYINQIQLNQFEIHEGARTRIRQNDFVNLLSNNYVFIDNEICEVLKMTWIDEKSYCEITYRRPSTWATGKVITQTINE